MGTLGNMNPDALLYGQDSSERIVAVEPKGSEAILYRREQGVVSKETARFVPWLIADRRTDLPKCAWTELSMPAAPVPDRGYIAQLAEFEDWDAFLNGRRVLSDLRAEMIAYASPARNFLARTGMTLFKGMAFDNLLRMQVDLETVDLNPKPPQNRIFMIAVRDTQGFEEALVGDETDILRKFVSIVQERDPDTIEGHNLFGFDVGYLAERARQCGVPLTLGRDGSAMTLGQRRNCPIGPYTRSFVPAYVHGRHLLDTYLSLQRWDAARGDLASYGLKPATIALGLAEPDRVYLEGAELAAIYKSDPDKVTKYAVQDVRETARLAELTLATEFYQTQALPESLQNVAVTGTGEKVDLLLARAYLSQGAAMPLPDVPRGFPGGYTEARIIGLVRPIVKADVESLYPSIMLEYGIKPSVDSLDVFLPALKTLTQQRLEAKRKAKEGGDQAAYWDALQGSLKVLINSFYGYLGGPFRFNDYNAAARVTVHGQQIVKDAAERLEKLGCQVVEIDTDGIYFRPPDATTTEAQERELIAKAAEDLPESIRLVHDGRYKGMLSLKIKNYVLESYSGHKIFKGASLRNRADERFGRDFVAEMVDAIFREDHEEITTIYRNYATKIKNGEFPVDSLAKRERVTAKTFQSKRSRPVVGDASVGEFLRVYVRQGNVLTRVEEYKNDEDREKYLDKLYRFAKRLEEAIPEFDKRVPPPKALFSEQQSLFEL